MTRHAVRAEVAHRWKEVALGSRLFVARGALVRLALQGGEVIGEMAAIARKIMGVIKRKKVVVNRGIQPKGGNVAVSAVIGPMFAWTIGFVAGGASVGLPGKVPVVAWLVTRPAVQRVGVLEGEEAVVEGAVSPIGGQMAAAAVFGVVLRRQYSEVAGDALAAYRANALLGWVASLAHHLRMGVCQRPGAVGILREKALAGGPKDHKPHPQQESSKGRGLLQVHFLSLIKFGNQWGYRVKAQS